MGLVFPMAQASLLENSIDFRSLWLNYCVCGCMFYSVSLICDMLRQFKIAERHTIQIPTVKKALLILWLIVVSIIPYVGFGYMYYIQSNNFSHFLLLSSAFLGSALLSFFSDILFYRYIKGHCRIEHPLDAQDQMWSSEHMQKISKFWIIAIMALAISAVSFVMFPIKQPPYLSLTVCGFILVLIAYSLTIPKILYAKKRFDQANSNQNEATSDALRNTNAKLWDSMILVGFSLLLCGISIGMDINHTNGNYLISYTVIIVCIGILFLANHYAEKVSYYINTIIDHQSINNRNIEEISPVSMEAENPHQEDIDELKAEYEPRIMRRARNSIAEKEDNVQNELSTA